jgi:DhnA family fructose-bisphosphate aldolase class Ia
MKPRLEKKLAALRADLNCGHFILADAKDADMAWGAASPGPPYPARDGGPAYRSIADFRDQIREVVRQGAVDVMLASASTMSVLAAGERLFDNSDVTPAIRANDATDIWLPRGGRYREEPSRPFASCFIAEVMPEVDLGLYSLTFNNQLTSDHESLTAFREFRGEANRAGFHYFLEVFAPNTPGAVADEDLPHFIYDHVCRMLAGVPVKARPEFLKIPYLGPAAMEELVAYDTSMIVGVMGGSSGTNYDAFKLLGEARKHGARAALFGRKIKDAEHPLSMVALLRRVADGDVTPEEAVRAYHGELEKLRIKPRRSLKDDAQLTACELSYAR